MGSPLNDQYQILQQVGSALYLLGIDVTLTQASVPAPVPAAGQPLAASVSDFYVYADTVTIAEDLINPGRAITILARQINLPGFVFLSVGGASPVTTFVGGNPPPPVQGAGPGAAGTQGQPGTTGLDGGSLSLLSPLIQVGTGGAMTTASPVRIACMTQLIEQGLGLAVASFMDPPPADPYNYPDNETVPISYGNNTEDLAFGGISVTGMGRPWFVLSGPTYVSNSSFTGFTVQLATQQITMTGTLSGKLFNIVPLSVTATGTCNPIITLHLTLNSTQSSLCSIVAPGCNSGTVAVTFSGSDQHALSQTQLDAVTTGLGTFISGLISDIVVSYFNSVSAQAVSPLSPYDAEQACYMLAQGGVGGRGQDGSPGVEGKVGLPGANTDQQADWGHPPAECVGKIGYQGGQGGSAGTSGAGGAGGSVTIGTTWVGDYAPRISVAGGAGGAPAFPGAPGAPGPGGPGGTYYSAPLGLNYAQVNAPDGPPGPPGPPAAFLGAQGATGAGGTSSSPPTTSPGGGGANDDDAGAAAVALLIPLGQLQIEQQSAKVDYLNAASAADYAAVAAKLRWLKALTDPFTQTGADFGNITATDAATRASINAATRVEIGRLAAGLDYYGNPFNYAPVLTLDWLQGRITQLVTLGTAISSQLAAYQAQENSAQIQALQSTQSSLQQSLPALQQSIQAINAQILTGTATAAALETQISQQQDVIGQAAGAVEQDFTIQQAPGCSFSQVLAAVGSIVQFGTAADTGVGDLTALLAMEQTGTALAGQVQNLLPADATSITSLQTAYQGIEGEINGSNPDSVKLVVAQEDFNTLVDSFFEKMRSQQGVTDIVALKEAFNHYVDLIQARNQILVNMMTLASRQAQQQAQYNQQAAGLANVAALLAADANPNLPDYIAFQQTALSAVLNDLLDQIYQANQAFAYWSGQVQPFSVVALDLGTLSAAANNISQEVESYMTGEAAPRSKFQATTITLDATDYPSSFASLPKTKRLAVTITPSTGLFASYEMVIVETVAVSLPGVTPPAKTSQGDTILELSLLQCGPDTLINGDNPLVFTHDPRPIPFQYDYTTGTVQVTGQVGDDSQGFAGLSPFSLWMIDFSSPQNSWLDLTAVKAVTLTFTGTLYQAASAAPKPKS